MKKALSIVFVCLLVLATQRASGQEVVGPLDISNNYPSPSGWNNNSATVGTCCARPAITESRNYYDILPNGSDRHSYTMTPSGVARGLPQNVSCGTGWEGTKPIKGAKPESLNAQGDSSQYCYNLFITGYLANGNQQWQIAFDSLTKLIETCPNYPNAPNAFLMLTSAVVGLHGPDGGTYRATHLAWLESVLYLNTTDPEYFCQCAEQIAEFLPYPLDTLPGNVSRETNIPLSVINWLIHNTTCDTPSLSQEYDRSRQTQLEQWANDPGAYKLDTTLPPLDSIQPGLKELLEKHFLYATVSGTAHYAPISNIAWRECLARNR